MGSTVGWFSIRCLQTAPCHNIFIRSLLGRGPQGAALLDRQLVSLSLQNAMGV
jgi:hypothetical protein